ncbi:MAG: pyridoxamine 5'-phosphate oxidase family protein [Muribaculaceae bacterium]|nr:pyridoxamine 5'-phosphate oxidase family protein [Muribaculaceae bacterium]
MTRKMRRFKQELSEEENIRILDEGKYAVVALSGDDGYPYSLPINYVYLENAIYIHSASEGHKIDAIKRNPKCSLCVVDRDDVVAEEFTSYFRSVIVFGKAVVVKDIEEKIKGLRLLCNKYSPGINPEEEINKFIKTVCVIRIDIERVTGKEAIELNRKKL